MTTVETRIASHYTTDDIVARIRAGLAAAGANPDAPSPDDLKPVDEFHVGGLEATETLLAQVEIGPGTRVLDIGSGLGGTARHIAATTGAKVLGIDLTPAFVEAAKALSGLVSLGDRTEFRTGSALALPVEDASADLATMIHVGMNIADKAALMREVARVLAPGGRFALFDLMLRGEGVIPFPVPWASEAAHSFVAPPDAYREAAATAGLTPEAERDRHAYAVAFFERVMAATAEAGGPPPVGLHLIMGPTAKEKYSNAIKAVMSGAIGPVEMIFRKP